MLRLIPCVIVLLFTVDCKWSEWGSWRGSCRTCLKPNQIRRRIHQKIRRYRYIDVYPQYGGYPCATLNGKKLTGHDEGEDEERQKKRCHSPACPAVAGQPYWSTWDDWSSCVEASPTSCAKSLDSGSRTRRRRCFRNGGSILQKECAKHHRSKNSDAKEACRAPCTTYSK